jgi:hypothetical protein
LLSASSKVFFTYRVVQSPFVPRFWVNSS